MIRRLSSLALALGFALPGPHARAADWLAGEGCRSRALAVPAGGRTFLQRLAPAATGIAFTNFVSEQKELENSLRAGGSGVAAGDVDGDGWCDLFFCGMERPSVLYRNLGNWRFEDATAAAGLTVSNTPATGAAFADVDGDGDLDLLVNSLGGGTRLFLNDGKGRFTESTDSGLIRRFGSTSLALADIDGDGDLDLYVCNYATTKIEDRPNARFDTKRVDGKPVLIAIDGVPLTSPELTNRYFVDAGNVVRERGEPDVLYVNDGRGHFQPVSWTGGSFLDEEGRPLLLPEYDFGLSVMFRDMNGDRAPDLYVCNDLFPPDRIWLNDGRGRFRAMSNLAVRNTCRFSMGIDFADINRDGIDDFFVVDMLSRDHVSRKAQISGVLPIFLPVGKIDNRPQYKRNTLFLGRGDGTYAEIAQYAGLEATEWSWMPVFLDVDLDGFEDVLVTTGHQRDSLHADAVSAIHRERDKRRLTDQEQRELKKKYYPMLRTSTQCFRNRGDLTFEDTARQWGFDYVGITHGLCLADLDNDGDLDVIIVPFNDVAGLYRNESSAPRVAVRLKGRAPNTRGIGAKIKLLGGAVSSQAQEMICGGRYLSSDDTVRVFAAGAAGGPMTIEVTWRNGAVSTVRGVKPNYLYEVDEASAKPFTQHATRNTPLFSDVSPLLNHTHTDDAFDDFSRQPTLGRKLSQLGPGVSWFDVDGDGWEDLTVGTGVNGRIAVFRNDWKGGFQRVTGPPFDRPEPRDLTTILGWAKSGGRRVLLAGSSNYEDAAPRGGCVREYDPAGGAIGGDFPAWECSTGPLAMADWDGDGVLDLFIGGRAMPARYPEEPFSLLLRGTGTNFVVDRAATRAIARAGMVSGAVFSDLDGDGLPELVLACDWGPVRIFRSERGRFTEWPVPVSALNSPLSTLNQLNGWWNSVATGDFDGDGRLDIVAGNWGRNTRFQSHRAQPQRIYFGEWMGNGVVFTFESYFDDGLKKYVPWASANVARSLPLVSERFNSYEEFGRAGIQDILGPKFNEAKALEASWFETTLFLNRGDRFEARPLPAEAQFSPAFGLCVADFDGDGNEDVFLSQNFFALDGDTSRHDAGRGLLLAGDGKGGFRAVPGEESGIKVYGEQRGAAVCDFDGDGRVDIAVTQNGAETRLYRNTRARPGLRVKLKGAPGNPDGIGAIVRLVSGGKPGPVREVHAGSGYWSQDAPTQVLSGTAPVTGVWCRWPGGRTNLVEVPAGAREVVLTPGLVDSLNR
ncbi:MAG TPA: VCBS repeat-containing protein [Verrucomicrobiae bacterium]|nr:VCBS repeat-containing protein [Verrucomicrobiae bacterium]